MIDRLRNLTQLTFPIITAKRYDWLSETSNVLIFDDIRLVKRGDLYKTFDLSITELPETYEMFPNPESLLNWVLLGKKLKGKIFIDDKLNVFVPQNLVKVLFETRTLVEYNLENVFIKVEGVSYFLPLHKVKEVNSEPVIALVEGLYFHVGWSNEGIRYERTF